MGIKKLFSAVYNSIFPSMDITVKLTRDLEEAKRELLLQIGYKESAHLNILYLENKIVRLSNTIKTRAITTDSGDVISIYTE